MAIACPHLLALGDETDDSELPFLIHPNTRTLTSGNTNSNNASQNEHHSSDDASDDASDASVDSDYSNAHDSVPSISRDVLFQALDVGSQQLRIQVLQKRFLAYFLLVAQLHGICK